MLIYTHPLLYQVVNVQNLLNLSGIKTDIRNQYSGGAAGDLAVNETWVELWLYNESDQTKARELINAMQSHSSEDWYCGQCGEHNVGTFDFCWNCQKSKPL